jgi:hypothetical protein
MATKSKNILFEKFKLVYYPLRNFPFIHKYILNFVNVANWVLLKRTYKTNSTLISRRIIFDLNTEGIAFSNLDEIFPDGNLLNEMQEWVVNNEKNLYPKAKKKFLLSYFGQDDDMVELDLSNPFFKFYLNHKITFLVNSYLGYIPQLNYVSVEKTIPVEKDMGPSHSQNWHRDPEEKRMIKVFIYINEVNERNGPFVYVKHSQPSGKSTLSKFAPQKLSYGSYPDEKSVLSKVKDKDLITAIGKAGTVIFCDTAGLHRGGLSFSGERIMATGFYPSKKWTEPSFIHIPANLDKKSLNSLAIEILKK